MKILLLNDNPVVTKLVTLSAQKSGNEILIADSVATAIKGVYDLLIVDEGVYSKESMDELNRNISYKYSLYMLSRGVPSVNSFDSEVKKPFLPTDLVDLLSTIAIKISNMVDETESLHKEVELDDFGYEDDFNKNLEASISDGTLDELDFDIANLDMDGLLTDEKFDENSVLDKDDVREVKNLLEETELDDEEFNFDDLEPDDEELLKDEPVKMQDEKNSSFDEEFDFSELDILDDDEIKDAEQERVSKEENMAFEEDEFLDTPLDMLDEHFIFDEKELSEDLLEDDMDLSEITKNESIEGEDEHIMDETLEMLEDDLDFDMLNEDALADDLDLSDLEDHSEDTEKQPENNIIPELDDDLDISELESHEEEHLDELDFSELADEELITADENEKELITELEDDLDLSELELYQENDDADNLTELSLEDIGEKLEYAIADLSEEELNKELDISLDGLDDLEGLDERALKIALGEDVADYEAKEEVFETTVAAPNIQTAQTGVEVLESTEEKHNAGVDALKTLLKALNNEDVVAALKGMNVNINISFGNNDDK